MPDADLPDPPAPGASPRPAGMPDLPKGDLRVASVIALITSAAVIVWHAVVATVSTTVILDDDGVRRVVMTQVLTWLLALVSFGCGLLSLNARRARHLAAAGFIAGCTALIISVSFAVLGTLPRFS